MSAYLKPEDANWKMNIIPKDKRLGELDEALIFIAFDEQTDFDISLIEKEMEDIKVNKRIGIIKLFSFVPEWVFTRIFLGKEIANKRLELSLLYVKFLFRKLTYKQFKNRLQKFVNGVY